MPNSRLRLFPALVAAIQVSTAAAGTPRPERPTFCAGHEPHPERHRSITPVAAPSDALLNDVAACACDAPDDAARQQKVAEFRAGLIASWGVSPAMSMASIGARKDLEA